MVRLPLPLTTTESSRARDPLCCSLGLALPLTNVVWRDATVKPSKSEAKTRSPSPSLIPKPSQGAGEEATANGDTRRARRFAGRTPPGAERVDFQLQNLGALELLRYNGVGMCLVLVGTFLRFGLNKSCLFEAGMSWCLSRLTSSLTLSAPTF